MIDFKNVEGLLYAYPIIKKSIEIDKETLKMLDDYEADIQAVKYDGVKVDKSDISNNTQREALDLISDKAYLNKKIKKNSLKDMRVEMSLEVLKETERDIVTKKYFDRYLDYEIYDDLCISKSTYYRMKNSAVKKIGDVLY